MEHSTHIFRDKKSDDKLEQILEPWGAWRAGRVFLLSFKDKSPMTAVNSPERDYTDLIDKKKKDVIREELKKLGYEDDLEQWVNQYYREWKLIRDSKKVPRGTLFITGHQKLYNSHIKYSEIDKKLATLRPLYYKILIHRYEKEWDYDVFCREWKKEYKYIKEEMSRARAEARKILRNA